jgi:hypothetical protein
MVRIGAETHTLRVDCFPDPTIQVLNRYSHAVDRYFRDRSPQSKLIVSVKIVGRVSDNACVAKKGRKELIRTSRQCDESGYHLLVRESGQPLRSVDMAWTRRCRPSNHEPDEQGDNTPTPLSFPGHAPNLLADGLSTARREKLSPGHAVLARFCSGNPLIIYQRTRQNRCRSKHLLALVTTESPS